MHILHLDDACGDWIAVLADGQRATFMNLQGVLAFFFKNTVPIMSPFLVRQILLLRLRDLAPPQRAFLMFRSIIV